MGLKINIYAVDVYELSETLAQFYYVVKPKSSKDEENVISVYDRNTLINIRAAINRHLADTHRNIDTVGDKEFKKPVGY